MKEIVQNTLISRPPYEWLRKKMPSWPYRGGKWNFTLANPWIWTLLENGWKICFGLLILYGKTFEIFEIGSVVMENHSLKV